MKISELAEIAVSVLVSLGGGGAIVAGLSNWLGKVWAERLMEKEKAHYQKELEDFKELLRRESDRTGLTLRERVSLYKEAITPIVTFVARYQLSPSDVTPTLMKEFEIQRLTTSAQLGMFASMPVFEAYNAVIDYLFDCLEAKRTFMFPEFRGLAFKVLTEIRKDVGFSADELIYQGSR